MKVAATCTRRPQQGFTLIELLVVLVVLGLVLSVAVPRFASGNPALAVRSAGLDLVAGLQLARNLAVSENRAVTIKVDRVASAFEVEGRRRGLPSGVTLTRPDLRDDERGAAIEVRFFPDGSSSGAQIGVVRGAHRLMIDVDWITGAIQVKKADARDA